MYKDRLNLESVDLYMIRLAFAIIVLLLMLGCSFR